MNHDKQLTAARIYMIFALALLVLGWSLCHSSIEQIAKAQDQRDAQIGRYLSSSE